VLGNVLVQVNHRETWLALDAAAKFAGLLISVGTADPIQSATVCTCGSTTVLGH
jgi:hypothetical protein